MDLSEEAIGFIKKNKKILIDKFANNDKHRPSKSPISFFMAGSPGAGKTEFSVSFIDLLETRINNNDKYFSVVRIDADDIRELLPGYIGSNSDIFQKATSVGVNKLYDYVIRKKLNCLLDTTFSSEKYAFENVERSIKKGREVNIFYVYQDPILAWRFAKAREVKEGRMIPRDAFIREFFLAKDNVNKIKKKYGDKVKVDLIVKDYSNKVDKFKQNIDDIDNFLKLKYTNESLSIEIEKLDLE